MRKRAEKAASKGGEKAETQVQLGWGQKTPGQLDKQQMEMRLFQKKCKK